MNKELKYFFHLLLIFVCFSAKGQRITGFNLYPIDKGIRVDFNIGPGPDCYGYEIYHSLDSMSYSSIYNYSGICGTSGTNEFISFTHTTATLNQINYYKVQLYPYEVAYNRILYSNSGQGSLLAYPNPVSPDNIVIHLKMAGVTNVNIEGYICNEFGTKVQYIDSQSEGDILEVDISKFNEGVFAVWLSDGARIYTTKFIVLREN